MIGIIEVRMDESFSLHTRRAFHSQRFTRLEEAYVVHVGIEDRGFVRDSQFGRINGQGKKTDDSIVVNSCKESKEETENDKKDDKVTTILEIGSRNQTLLQEGCSDAFCVN
jgi:hypothetical protein